MIHGLRSTYTKGCKCDPCRAANARYAKVAKYRSERGLSTLVDAAPVRRHIEHLRANGMGRRTIAERSGVSETVINRLAGVDRSRPAQRTRPETARAILNVTSDQLADGAFIDGIGTTRRIQALVAIGWTQTEQARLIGWTITNLNALAHGHDHKVTRRTANLINDLYNRLSMTPGPSQRARDIATRYGWAPPLAWDDDTIDQSHATPDTGTHTSRKQAVIEDIHELRLLGNTTEAIAQRLRIKPSTVLTYENAS